MNNLKDLFPSDVKRAFICLIPLQDFWIDLLFLSFYPYKYPKDAHMGMHTCALGHLAASQALHPAQRAIVVSYDNELNMVYSGMCENRAASV